MIEALLPIGLLVVVAKLAEGILGRLGLNSIVAFTITGIILGPVAGIVEPVPELQVFLGIGVFVLFFLVGLDEIDIPGFVSTIRGRFFVASTVSVTVSLLAALAVTSDLLGVDFALNLHLTEALALAGILSLSSLGLVAKVLADEGNLKEPIGLEIFTTVIIAELLALLVVGFTIGEHGREFGVVSIAILLGQIAGFTVVSWVLSARLLPILIVRLQRLLRTPELSFGLLVGGLFLMVVAAEEIGLHGTIGALLFGAALSGLPRQVREDVMPGIRSTAEGLFVPLFFASAGLRLDLSFLDLPVLTIVVLVAVPLLGKFAGATLGSFVARLDKPFAQATGLMAKGVAEIALLLVLLEAGVIGKDVFSLLVLIMFGYILLMPMAISFAVNRAKSSHQARPPGAVPPSFARYALEGITVNHVVDRTRQYPDPSISIREFSEGWVVPNQHDYLAVENGSVAGIVSLTRLRFVPKGTWADTPIRNVLRTQPPSAYLEEPIDDVLKRMADHSLTVLPVQDRSTEAFLGTVNSHDVLDLVILMEEIAAELESRGEQGAGAATGDSN